MNKFTTLVALSSVLFGSYGFAAEAPNAPTKPALTVTATQPQSLRLPINFTANGNIAAWQEALISSESNGLKLLEVKVNVGDVVKAGQELALFNAEVVANDVAQARANLLEAEANLGEATRNAERARSLQGSGAMSEQDVGHLLVLEQIAKAKLESAKVNLQAQQLRLKYTKVLAPDSGVISARNATVGAVVGAGTELFRMIRQEKLEWRAEVTEAELGKLHAGMPVNVTTVDGQVVKGKVRKVAPTVDAHSRLALVYVDLPAHDALKAGMFAKGDFVLGSSAGLSVPQQAVVVRDGFNYVFRLNKDKRVSQLKVVVGRRLNGRVEILSGIDAHSLFVTQGAGFLNDGDLVKN